MGENVGNNTMRFDAQRFQKVFSEILGFYIAHTLTSLSIFISMILLLTSGLIVALLFSPYLSGSLLLALLTVVGTYVVRLVIWITWTFKSLWERYRPPITSENMIYQSPLSETKYEYDPTASVIGFHLVILSIAFVFWILIQIILSNNIDLVIGVGNWLYNLLPASSKAAMWAVIAFFSGISNPPTLAQQIDTASLIKNLLYLPQIFFSVLIIWNLQYYYEIETLNYEVGKIDYRIEGSIFGEHDVRGLANIGAEILKRAILLANDLIERRLVGGLITSIIILLVSVMIYGFAS